MLGLSQTSDAFEVLVEDDEKYFFLFSAHHGEHMKTEVQRAAYPETLGETLGPRFDLVSDLVLVQRLEKPRKTTNHKFAAERKQVVKKPHSLLMPGKTSNQSLESAGGAKQTTVRKL